MKHYVLFILAIALSGCTQWGTSALRPVDVWWACPDRNEKCSSERAALTLAQMDNTFAAVRRDLCRAERSGRVTEEELTPLRDAVREVAARRPAVPLPLYWGDGLADYAQAVVTAERVAVKLYPRVYGRGAWKANMAQAECSQ